MNKLIPIIYETPKANNTLHIQLEDRYKLFNLAILTRELLKYQSNLFQRHSIQNTSRTSSTIFSIIELLFQPIFIQFIDLSLKSICANLKSF